ncbi:hypothetical protein AJ79_01589 [Helicocarpus griseus UAMH5409]|uniref:DUF7779 domain-containing protein n=1 Tax=Helicocarpus griseus UAMH5409 TaxID=1447875 RepID=A0A2B7Y5G3_9EURO|nr:hypothetical protein AJ79_01589 [Helicocarpus griseus UAMH5409]
MTSAPYFWLSGEDRGTLLQSSSSVLPRLPGQSRDIGVIDEKDVEQRARHVLEWIASQENPHWLIIFDNVDQYSPNGVGVGYDISEFFPRTDQGSILISSRLQKLTELASSFPVQKLESKDAVQLLSQSSGLSAKNTMWNPQSDPGALDLANRLDGLPLAIVIAGAFIHETGTSILDYLKYYTESWYDLRSQSSPGRQYQHGNILQTWQLSYREIQKRDLDAAKLLLLLAYFDNRDIWYELVQAGSNSPNTPPWFNKAVSEKLAFGPSMKTLIGFSLIETKQQEGSYAMHPVVQDWCLHVARTEDMGLIQLNEQALIAVGCMVPFETNKNHPELQRRLVPHANFVLRGGNDPSAGQQYYIMESI